MYTLANSPTPEVNTWPNYCINRFRFKTTSAKIQNGFTELDSIKNSCVYIKSSNNTNVDPGNDFYDILREIIELTYNIVVEPTKVVLFNCNWFDSVKNQGWKIDKHGLVDINYR